MFTPKLPSTALRNAQSLLKSFYFHITLLYLPYDPHTKYSFTDYHKHKETHTHTPPILLSLCKMLVWIWDTSFVPRFFSLTPVSLSVVSILSDCCPSRARAGAKQPRGMRSLLSQLSILCCAKFYTLSHRQVVTVVQTALYPLLAS